MRAGECRSVLTLHTGRHCSAAARVYERRSPVLVVEFASAMLLLGTHREDTCSATDVAFARELAGQVSAWAVAVERMHRGLPTVPAGSAVAA